MVPVVISTHRDIMMRVADAWETTPPEEKDRVLKLCVDDVQRNLNNRAYEFKSDVLADFGIIKKLNSIFEPLRMKHKEDICRALLDKTRAMQGILKIQVLMADLLSSGEGKEIKKWMMQKMEDAGRKKDILKYLYRYEEKEESIIYSLEKEIGAKVENPKKAKRVNTGRGFKIGKCDSLNTKTKKDRRALMKKYLCLEEEMNCASSKHTELCRTKLPFDAYSIIVLQCLRRLKVIVEYQMYELM